MIDPMLPIPFALVQVASTSLLCAARRPRNVVCSIPSRLGKHPGEATLLHGKAVKARSATSKIHTSGLWIGHVSGVAVGDPVVLPETLQTVIESS